MKLYKTLAQICYFAQEHSHDWDDRETRDDVDVAMEHVSHVVSCFIAQHTIHGSEGVDSNIVLDLLRKEVLTLKKWENIFQKICGDWNTP